MEIKRQRTTKVTYSLVFDSKELPGFGYSFPCDAEGNVDFEKSNRENYDRVSKSSKYHLPYIQDYKTRIPALGECACGDEVCLTSFTNTCDTCSRDYNLSGQLLAPRHFWGEETGESLSDILTGAY